MRLIKTLSLLLVLICLADCIKIVDRVVPKSKKLKIVESSSYAEAYSEYMKEYSEVEDRPASGWVGNNADFVRKQIQHKRNFVHQLRHIKEHNKKFARGWSGYELTVNSFTIMDEKERLSFTGLTIDNSTEIELEEEEDAGQIGATNTIGAEQLPKSWCWTEKGYVTPIKSQDKCASCWAFSAIAVLEWVYKKATGKLLELSEQELLDCTYQGTGCNGGWYTNAWQVVMKSGHIASMKDYRYQNRAGYCNSQRYKNQFSGAVRITGYKKSKPNEQSVLSDLVNHMPLAVAILTEQDFFIVSDGIYDGCPVKKQVTHGVTLTGYGEKYFKIKNSWGADWGDDGYAKMKRGKDICQLLSYAHYVMYQDLNPKDGNEAIPKNDAPEPKKATNKTPSEDDESCRDTGEKDCKMLVKEGLCYNPLARYVPSNHCKKSCGFCGCTDYDKGCEEYKELGFCAITSMLYMSHTKKFCLKTCGLCDPNKKPSSSSDKNEKDDKKSSENGGCPSSLVWCKDASDPKGGYCIHVHMCKSAQH